MAEDAGPARASARSSAAKSENQANDKATDEADAAAKVAEAVAEAVAKALGDQFTGALREVFREQRDIIADQASLRRADSELVQGIMEEMLVRREKDAELLKKIEQADTKRPESAPTARRIDAEPGQLLLGLQFNALSNALSSRKRTGVNRDDSMIPPPEIRRATTGGKLGFTMHFVASLPSAAATVGIQYLDKHPRDLVRVDKLSGNSLDLASDQVQFVELLDGRALPIAFGIPYRR